MAIKTVKIMLDPGHDKARYNQGAIPAYWEGERMWALSQLLKTALTRRGFTVGTTKSKCDQSIDVVTRGRMARGYTALISLHTDACADPSVDRPTGIYLVDDNCGPIDEESRELAKLLSATCAATIGTRYRAQQYSRESGNDRNGNGKLDDDYYGVLYGAHQVGVPAIILEHTFHTCPASAEWLMDNKHLEELADALAAALADYYGMTAHVTTPAPTTTTKEGYAVNMKTLKKGCYGKQVKTLQALLIGYGYDCGRSGADGDFGGATDSALRKFQSRNGLTVDGVAGPKTWAKLLGQ